MILTLLLFIVILGSIVLVHESGHFIFAKLVGVHVYEFSIGMGPVIFKKIAKDKTQDFINIISNTNPNIEIKTILEGPVFKTNLNNQDIKKYLKVCKKILNKEIDIISCESTSDAVYFSEHKIPTIIMNPDGYYPHCENEYVNKESLVTLYNIYYEFIQKED